MGIKWSDPKIEKEKVKIEPELFIKEAKEYTESGDYNMAERAYVNALSNARGASNVKEIVRIVKNGLSEIYSLWIKYCIKCDEYQDALPVLQKLQKISDDKTGVKKELVELYDAWGISLSRNDKNWIGAITIFIKKIRLEKELGFDTKDSEERLAEVLYATKNSKYRKKSNQLHFSNKKFRYKLLIRALIESVVALVTPLIQFSFFAYMFSFVMLYFYDDGWGLLYPDSNKKAIRNCVGLTCFSFAWLIITEVFGKRSNINRELIISFVITIIISVRLMIHAIGELRIYFSYQNKDVLDVIEGILPEKTIRCKSCKSKLKVSGETLSAVKCPKCGIIVREAVDLKIKNKSLPFNEEVGSIEAESKNEMSRAGAIAVKFAVKEIMRNIHL